MGLFDRFKKKEEPKKEERDIANFSVPLSDGISEMVVDGLTRIQNFRHRDNSRTSLVMGRIERVEGSNAFYLDSADYIAFELPEGQKITEDAVLAAVRQYTINKNSAQAQSKAFYVGKVQDGRIAGDSVAVQQYVEQTVAQMEAKRSQMFQQQMQQKQRQEAAAREKQQAEDERRRLENEAVRSRERSARLQKPQLRSNGSYQVQGMAFSEYDGVDMINGDILRLRQVNKVCKDAEGTYLYSAYVNKVEHEYDVEILGEDEPAGDYVCFTLPGRLEDIVKAGNPDQIKTVLELLSAERPNSKELTYIGGIDRSGQIVRDAMPRSSGIANRVAQMKQAYSARKQQLNGRNASSYDDGR